MFLFFLLIFKIGYAVKIDEIKLSGNNQIPDRVIFNNLTFKVNEEFVINKLSDSYKALYDLGYIKTLKIAPVVKNGKLTIEIEIFEKENVYQLLRQDKIYTKSDVEKGLAPPIIADVKIEGNYLLEDSFLQEIISVVKGSDYSLDRLNLAKIKLEKTGFFSNVYFTSIHKAPKEIEVTFYVNENKRISSKVIFKGNQIISTEELESVIIPKKDFLLNKNEIQQDIANIQKLYGKIDLSNVDINVLFEGETLVYEITEPLIGDIYFLREQTAGYDTLKTKDYVLRRAVNLPKGELLTKSIVGKNISSLMRLGFFHNIIPDISVNSFNPKYRDITFLIQENSGFNINFSMNGNLAGDLKFNMGASDHNFLGRELQFDLNINIDLLQSKWETKIAFKDPWIAGTYGLAYGFELFRTSEDTRKEFGYFNKTVLTGLGGMFGIPIFSKDFMFNIKDSVKLVEHFNDKKLWDIYFVNSLGFDLVMDKLNNRIYPTAGFLGLFSFSWDIPFKAAGVEYINFVNKSSVINLHFLAKGYIPFIFQQNTIATRLDISWNKFVSEKEINFFGRSLGGYTTLRGYEHEQFKGNFSILINIEDRILIYDNPSLKVEFALFFDVGIVLPNNDFFDIFNVYKYKKSTGISLRFINSIIPFFLNFSYPIDVKESYFIPEFGLGYIF